MVSFGLLVLSTLFLCCSCSLSVVPSVTKCGAVCGLAEAPTSDAVISMGTGRRSLHRRHLRRRSEMGNSWRFVRSADDDEYYENYDGEFNAWYERKHFFNKRSYSTCFIVIVAAICYGMY